jgi:hypothetical protein
MNLIRVVMLTGACALLAAVLLVPFAHATDVTTVPNSSDSSFDNLAQVMALKTHVAYVGEAQQARMDGVIRYIDAISNGTGSFGLRMIEQNYMATVSSVPLMFTASEVGDARGTLQDLSQKFSDETMAKMNAFNGSREGLESSINRSLSAFDDSLASVPGPLWLAQDSARLIVFNDSSRQRGLVLAWMGAAGVDTTKAQQISGMIDAKFPDVKAAIASGQKGAIQEVNRAIWDLSQQFRAAIEEYQNSLKAQAAAASILAIPS